MSDDQLVWTDPAWRAEVTAWIDAQLKRHQIHRIGEIEQPHIRPWSTVLRAPTDQGSFYLKALPENLRHEVEVVAGLGDRFPDRVPRLLAFDPSRGWMLQFDGGRTLRQVLNCTPATQDWLRTLLAYAEMQVGLADDSDLMSSWGVPDRRPSHLPSLIRELIEEAGPLHLGHPKGLSRADRERLGDVMSLLDGLCAELGRGAVPVSLNHGDLHDGNIFLRDRDIVFFDWGDCSLSHPFVSLRTLYVSLETRRGWEEGDPRFPPLTDRYLRAWGHYAEMAELRRLMGLALTVAPLVSALSWRRALTNLSEVDENYIEPVPRLLEEFLANLKNGAGPH